MPTLPPELRRVPPDSFVATRDAVSRRLREAGDRDAAAEVRRLRRPPPSLWAINQLSEVAAGRVEELVRAADALRTTTQAALRGDQGELGWLSSRHARLVDELTGRAMQLLAGLPAPATSETRSRVWTMLRVASLDPELAAGLAAGSLAEEPVGTGFDSLLGFELGPAPARRRRPSSRAPTEDADADEDSGRRRRDQAEEVRAASAAVEAARAEASDRRQRLDRARERIADLRKQTRAAEREANRLEHDLVAAEETVARAEAVVEQLRAGPKE